MRHFVLVNILLLMASLFAVAAMPLVNNSNISYNVSPNQITINGSGFSPQGKAPIALFNNVNLGIV